VKFLANKKNHTELIDVDKIISEKNPKLYKSLPQFIIRYIKKTVHQKELNVFIANNIDNIGVDFLKQTFINFQVKSTLKNSKNLPSSGKYIFVSNHPVGSFDGLHIIDILNTKYGKVKAIVNDVLLNLKSLNEFFVGVNKHGATPREQIESLNKIFESDVPVFFFPAGLVSRKLNGFVMDGDWKKTFVTRAIKHKRNIIPIHIEGKLSNKFYRIARIRKFFRIKANLEMFFLVDEGLKQKGANLKITIGKPIDYKILDKSKKHFVWAQEIKKHIYKISKNADAVFLS